MKYPCLVVDHDDTVVQSTVQIHYPAFVHTLEWLRPQVTPLSCVAFQEACAHPGLVELYEQTYGFTKEEMALELEDWRSFVKEKIPDAFAGLGDVLTAYTRAGGKIFVVSHSDEALIRRDYLHHFGFEPNGVYDLTYPNNKPHPDPVLAIMEEYGFAKNQVLVVDDLPIGLQMAQSAGVDFAYAGWCQNPPSVDEKMVAESSVVLRLPRDLLELL